MRGQLPPLFLYRRRGKLQAAIIRPDLDGFRFALSRERRGEFYQFVLLRKASYYSVRRGIKKLTHRTLARNAAVITHQPDAQI